MKRIVGFVVVSLCALNANAKKKPIPPAPLPAQVTQATTIFLVNGGGSDTAFDEFYQDMKAWGKYQIVGTQDQADLIIEVRYSVPSSGHGSTPIYNSYTKQTTYYDYNDIDPQVQVTISDAKTHAQLWTGIDHRKLVRMAHNRDKEIAKSADRIVEDLKARSQ